MAVTNVKGVIFLGLHGNNENAFIMRSMVRDLDLEEELIEQEDWFWNRYVREEKPPEYTEPVQLVFRSIRDRLGVKDSQVVELPKELSGCVTEYPDLKKWKSELDK